MNMPSRGSRKLAALLAGLNFLLVVTTLAACRLLTDDAIAYLAGAAASMVGIYGAANAATRWAAKGDLPSTASPNPQAPIL